MRMTLTSAIIFLPETHYPRLTMKEISHKPKISTKYLNSAPLNCRGHQKLGRSEKQGKSRGSEGDRITFQDRKDRILKKKKHIRGKANEIQTKHGV